MVGKDAGNTCIPCTAWRGELGGEPTPEQFIANLVEVFGEVRRVLRDDGTLWLNLGDSYAGSGKGPSSSLSGLNGSQNPHSMGINSGLVPRGYKAKDLMLMPFRVALALQADGWWLRSAITWCKKSPMPESVVDRPTSATEMIFLFSKKATYYYDQEAIREPAEYGRREVKGASMWNGQMRADPRDKREGGSHTVSGSDPSAGRNSWNYWILEEAYERLAPEWTEQQRAYAERALEEFWRQLVEAQPEAPMAPYWLLSPEPYSAAHFATFVTEIPRRAILAGTSERGACPACGAAWRRVVERGNYQKLGSNTHVPQGGKSQGENGTRANHLTRDGFIPNHSREQVTTGWAPSCRCDAGEPVPCVVLDCFAGAGTSLLVADRLGRNAIGIELNPEYARMAEDRIRGDAPMLTDVVTAAPDQERPQKLRAWELFHAAGLRREHFDAVRAAGITDTGKAVITQTGAGKNTPEVLALAAEAKVVLKGYYRELLSGTYVPQTLTACTPLGLFDEATA